LRIDAVRWAVTVALGVPSLLVILGNWAVVAGAAVHAARGATGRGFSFGLPWVAGPVGAAACACCPVALVRQFAWSPMVLDPSYLVPALALAAGVLHRPPAPDPPTDARRPGPG